MSVWSKLTAVSFWSMGYRWSICTYPHIFMLKGFNLDIYMFVKNFNYIVCLIVAYVCCVKYVHSVMRMMLLLLLVILTWSWLIMRMRMNIVSSRCHPAGASGQCSWELAISNQPCFSQQLRLPCFWTSSLHFLYCALHYSEPACWLPWREDKTLSSACHANAGIPMCDIFWERNDIDFNLR